MFSSTACGRGMRLQSDPTVLYGVDGGEGREIRRSDLKRRTEWNTYVIKGAAENTDMQSQSGIDRRRTALR